MRTVYLEPAMRMHSLYLEMIAFPPKGFKFLIGKNLFQNGPSSSTVLRQFHSLNWSQNLIPTTLVASFARSIAPKPKEADLTYASNHLVFRNEPWLVDVEFLSVLIGIKRINYAFKTILERTFASANCRGIICWTQMSKMSIESNLNTAAFSHKIEVVPLAVRKKTFAKQRSANVRILFVGSANIPGEFIGKGGREVVAAFALLRQKLAGIELVIRSDIPPDLKNWCRLVPGIQIIDKVISRTELESLYSSADIFVLPSYITPGVAILEAMSYELPVVTTDVWANSELVSDGVTGFVVPRSRKVNWFVGRYIPAGWESRQFTAGMKCLDSEVVASLADRLAVMAEDENLRRNMGLAARRSVEEGVFSISRRNEKLRRIFEEAVR